MVWVVSPCPNPKLEGHPVGCLRLLIQYIRSYPPYLEAVSYISNLRMCHAVVTREYTVGPYSIFKFLTYLNHCILIRKKDMPFRENKLPDKH
jgi:hypothetical protein